MWQYAIKVAITAIMVVAVSELAKRSSLLGAVLASLPLTSLLAFIWLYLDTGDKALVASLSSNIFWLVLPSLMLFVALPILLRCGLSFWPGLATASALTILTYFSVIWLLTYLGIRF
jgi:hypothetical protein